MAQTIQVDANITKASFGTRGLTCFATFYMECLCDAEITCDIRASCTAYACNPRYVLSLKCKEDDAAWLSPGLSLTKKRAYATRFQQQNNTRATNSTNNKKTRVSSSVFNPRGPDMHYSVSRWIDGLGPAKTSIPNDAWSVSACNIVLTP
jgi:hypothetical protein